MTYSSLSLSRLSPVLSVAVAIAAVFATAPVHAQQNGDVSVNLEALGLSPTLEADSEPRLILKYPGSSTATRQVPQLRYPSVPAPTARPKPPTTTVKATPAAVEAPAPKAATEAAKPAAQPAAKVAVTPPAKPASPEQKPAARSTATAAATPSPQPVEVPPAPVAAQPAEEPQVAALAPPAPVTALPDPDPAILRVLFDEDTAAIIGSARNDLDAIGESLRYDPRRIELKAYGGEPGNKASEARRISLKRGLAVRAYLIGLGIDSRRIDVRALGGVTDTGSADRVDVAYSGT